MLIIPAIDLSQGSCVRLVQGDPKLSTVYSSNPIQMAKEWEKRGAKRIHIVDLDGAFSGEPVHMDLVEKMRKEVQCEIEFGGGLRNKSVVTRALGKNIDKLILGTAAILHSDWVLEVLKENQERFMVSIDSKNDQVSIEGWTENSPLTTDMALKNMEKMGFKEIIYTDISRDGTLKGPNLDAVKKVVSKTKMKVIASGGVSNIEDVKKLKEIEGLGGIIIGKALYSGQLTLEECLKL